MLTCYKCSAKRPVITEKLNDDVFCAEAIIEDHKQNLFTPQMFDDYLGQRIVKDKLKVYVQASKMRSDALDHILLFGPPGLGKTTLAKVIANELGVNFKSTSAPALERVGDLVAILSSLEHREILFIDEIHRLPKVVEESLYSAMESFFVDIIVGQGTGAKVMQLPLNRFTLIAATTKTGALSGPLQTRFGIVERLEFYEAKELAEIVLENAKKIGLKLNESAAIEIGKRARGTPRIAKRIIRRIRDFAQVKNIELIEQETAIAALDFLNIDEKGLDMLDQKILTILARDFNGGPVGLDTLAAASGEDKQTLEDYCEPYLIRLGILQKTARGRKISDGKRITFEKGKPIVTNDGQHNLFE